MGCINQYGDIVRIGKLRNPVAKVENMPALNYLYSFSVFSIPTPNLSKVLRFIFGCDIKVDIISRD